MQKCLTHGGFLWKKHFSDISVNPRYCEAVSKHLVSERKAMKCLCTGIPWRHFSKLTLISSQVEVRWSWATTWTNTLFTFRSSLKRSVRSSYCFSWRLCLLFTPHRSQHSYLF